MKRKSYRFTDAQIQALAALTETSGLQTETNVIVAALVMYAATLGIQFPTSRGKPGDFFKSEDNPMKRKRSKDESEGS